ncbi:MAG: hypothetical protein ACREOP_14290, partial [Thermodesulfobacteriota bacterium]
MFSNILNRFYDPAFAQRVFDWLVTSGARILIIAVGAYVLIRITNGVIGRVESIAASRATDFLSASEAERRLKTMTSLLRSMVFLVIAGIAAVMALRELGMDIAPILAGAGILGLAVSFGGQNLVR